LLATRSVLFLVLVATVISVASATTFDFITADELNNFEKLMIDENGSVSSLNTSMANITLNNGILQLKTIDGIHKPGIAYAYMPGYVYAVKGSNIWLGVIANGTLVGSIQINGIGYLYYEGEKGAAVDDGQMQIKIIADEKIDKVVVYSENSTIDKFGINMQIVQLGSSGHDWYWSGSTETTKKAYLKANTKYKLELVQKDCDWDVFIFSPANSNYKEANEKSNYYWLRNTCTYKHYADGKTIIATATGQWKFIFKKAPTYARSPPPGTWAYSIDRVGYVNPAPTPTSTSDSNNEKDESSGHWNWDISLDENTKLMLCGIGAFVVLLAVIATVMRR